MVMEFIGREAELELLERIFTEERVKTCMIYGRRRIGKTSLILKFIEKTTNALAPQQKLNLLKK